MGKKSVMNCHYHPDNEAVGMCVSCGQPICLECKVVLKDDRLYCNQCVADGKAPQLYERGSLAWWMLPVILGFIGGIIAYFATKDKTPMAAEDYLWVSLMVTVWISFLCVLIANI